MLGMNVSGVPTAVQTAGMAARASATADDKRAALGVMLLRKALDAQKDQAAQLARMIEGKGQTIDIRV